MREPEESAFNRRARQRSTQRAVQGKAHFLLRKFRSPPASPSVEMPPRKAEEPSLGLQPRRLALSAVLWAIAAAYLYHVVDNGGLLDVLGSHLRAAPWNPLVPPCGLLEAKEFVIMSDRVATRGQILPGAGAPGLLAACPCQRDQWRKALVASCWCSAGSMLLVQCSALCSQGCNPWFVNTG